MAAHKDAQDDEQPQAEPQAERPRTRTEQEQRDISRVAQEAADKRLDETVPGGRYADAEGNLIDAHGNPLKKQG